jgi:tRNA(fMet)-specific endonuclease VapC
MDQAAAKEMIAAVAIDTNAYSGFRRGTPELVEVFGRVPRLIVPLVVIAELLAGFAGGKKAQRNRAELGTFLSSPRVALALPDRQTAEGYAEIYQQLRRDGRPIPTNDIWVAAAALQATVPLITLDAHYRFVTNLRSASGLSQLLGTTRRR